MTRKRGFIREGNYWTYSDKTKPKKRQIKNGKRSKEPKSEKPDKPTPVDLIIHYNA